MRANAADQCTEPPFGALLGAADEFLRADLAYLRRLPISQPDG
jgi:hypothetical protein